MLEAKPPTTNSPTKAEFDQLAEQWQRETRGHDVAAMSKHPAHQEIIAMGQIAIPWILESLAANGHDWFIALSQITGATPVPPESRGQVPVMTKSWLDWDREQGYIQ